MCIGYSHLAELGTAQMTAQRACILQWRMHLRESTAEDQCHTGVIKVKECQGMQAC